MIFNLSSMEECGRSLNRSTGLGQHKNSSLDWAEFVQSEHKYCSSDWAESVYAEHRYSSLDWAESVYAEHRYSSLDWAESVYAEHRYSSLDWTEPVPSSDGCDDVKMRHNDEANHEIDVAGKNQPIGIFVKAAYNFETYVNQKIPLPDDDPLSEISEFAVESEKYNGVDGLKSVGLTTINSDHDYTLMINSDHNYSLPINLDHDYVLSTVTKGDETSFYSNTANNKSTDTESVTADKKKGTLCSSCGRPFSCRMSMKGNSVTHDKCSTKCLVCGRSPVPKRNIWIDCDIKPFKCSICYKQYVKEPSLKEHILTRHSDVLPFSCSIGYRTYAPEYAVTQHSIIHKNGEKFLCSICGLLLEKQTSFNQHMINHNSSLRCSFCDLWFFEKWQLDDHVCS